MSPPAGFTLAGFLTTVASGWIGPGAVGAGACEQPVIAVNESESASVVRLPNFVMSVTSLKPRNSEPHTPRVMGREPGLTRSTGRQQTSFPKGAGSMTGAMRAKVRTK